MTHLTAEAVLDPSIQFQSPKQTISPKGIFLTGATGFLGVYLLDELLRTTEANIYCLIRGDGALARLQSQLELYGLWQAPFRPRIIPIAGNLAQPRLGLSSLEFEALAKQIDVIYHNGALVNAVYAYTQLKAPNVLGTEEVLRLASLGQTKPVHFISTVAVFFSQPYRHRTVYEHEIPIADDSFKGGYKQSKWVAEHLVRIAGQRGLPTTIHRLGRVLGHSGQGVLGSVKDLICLVLKACVLLGQFPQADTQINLIPCDYAVQAIVQLSQQPNLATRTFHLYNPSPMAWADILPILRNMGYSLEEVPYQAWIGKLKRTAADYPNDQFYATLRLLMGSPLALFGAKPHFDNAQTHATLGLECPATEVLLAGYLRHLQQTGFLQ
jgi:thioester reductase-like protein